MCRGRLPEPACIGGRWGGRVSACCGADAMSAAAMREPTEPPSAAAASSSDCGAAAATSSCGLRSMPLMLPRVRTRGELFPLVGDRKSAPRERVRGSSMSDASPSPPTAATTQHERARHGETARVLRAPQWDWYVQSFDDADTKERLCSRPGEPSIVAHAATTVAAQTASLLRHRTRHSSHSHSASHNGI